MIPVARLPEPQILTEKKVEWLATYLAARLVDPNKHPPSGKYAHADIVDALERMSFHKCFYCEQSTKECAKEIDHFIESSEAPGLAFEWTNLYLSCRWCNDKLPNRTVPMADCLDPCEPSVEPHEHITFAKELIRSRGGSVRGRQTIKKYKLDRADLDLKRARMLNLLTEAVVGIFAKMNAEGRQQRSAEENEMIQSFRQPEHPFSLMFAVSIDRLGL